ncbi:MAG: CDP-diacylglycerol--serine O-phosphatidyltransferase [Rhizobiaceae bacterium]
MDAPFQPFDPHGPTPPGRRLGAIELRFILPNLITILAICAGLTGIRFAFEGRIAEAVGLVLIAAFLDGIDGRLARAMKAQSKFGAQMDSLADIVNFGVAPAMVLYASVLDQARSFGWIAAQVYVVACGLRLARFNVMADDPNKPAWAADFFVGVPAPFGAFLVMLPLYVNFLGIEAGRGLALLASAYTVLIALLMISQIPVFSGKSTLARIPGGVILPALLAVTVYVTMLLTFTWETLTVSALAYFASIPLGVSSFKKRLKAKQPPVQPDPKQS